MPFLACRPNLLLGKMLRSPFLSEAFFYDFLGVCLYLGVPRLFFFVRTIHAALLEGRMLLLHEVFFA